MFLPDDIIKSCPGFGVNQEIEGFSDLKKFGSCRKIARLQAVHYKNFVTSCLGLQCIPAVAFSSAFLFWVLSG